MPTTPTNETRQEARQRIKQNIQRRNKDQTQQTQELITVDLFDNLRDDNIKFFRLFDYGRWEDLKATYKDPSNKKELGELIGDLLNGNKI